VTPAAGTKFVSDVFNLSDYNVVVEADYVIIRGLELKNAAVHGFNDGIGSGTNYSFQGSPNRDFDIYGNLIANCWDDAIEREGANRNVRIKPMFLPGEGLEWFLAPTMYRL